MCDQNFGFEIILTMYYKLVMQCSIEECPNPPLAHGLCSDHSRISFAHHHPISSIRNGADVTMAGRFFHSLSIQQPQGDEKLEVVLPVVRVPFIQDEATFKYHNYKQVDERGYPVDERGNPVASFNYTLTKSKKSKRKLVLREELVEGIGEPNVLDRPVVFLVTTNIPHTGIYILYGGQFYSVAFGYDTSPATGSLYSIDIPLILFSEARIVWIGILTDAIVERLQAEFDRVTHIFGNFKPADVAGPLIVDRLMFFHTPRAYGGIDADADPTRWNCTKWAMHVLFGDRMPANFRDLVSRTNPGLNGELVTRWLAAYSGRDQDEFKRVLRDINHASFPRISAGGRRGRMTNNRNNRNNTQWRARSNRPLTKKILKMKTRKNKRHDWVH